MSVTVRSMLMGVACCVAGAGPVFAVAVDAGMVLDEFNARRFAILNCHAGQDAEDRAFLAKEDAVRRDALNYFKARLDMTNPGSAEDNVKRAEEMLEQRQKAREFDISEQIRNYGCPWLDDQFKLANPFWSQFFPP